MNTASAPSPTSPTRLHPLVIAACAAVILVSLVGIAAIMGWLPNSSARNSEASAAAPASSASSTAMPLAAVTAPPAQTATAKPVTKKPVVVDDEPVRTVAAAPVCADCGVVESTRQITTPAKGSGVGAVGGAVVGGVLGHQVGGGKGKDVMTVLGAVGGAFAGNHIEGQVKATHSYEIVVRMEDGSTRTLHQAELGGLVAGDRVRVHSNGVVRANG